MTAAKKTKKIAAAKLAQTATSSQKEIATKLQPSTKETSLSSKKMTAQSTIFKIDKKTKPEKIKVIRDSFTIPKNEYAAIAEMKKRALALGISAKKSELIRAGLALLKSSTDSTLRKALAQVPTLKTGRPSKI